MNKASIVVITGASSGIGKALAELYTAGGDLVYALARSLDDTPATSAANPRNCKLDVTDAAAAERVLKSIVEREGRIDLLVLAAGFGLAGSVEAMTAVEASDQMRTNFLGVCHLLSPALTIMRKQGGGRIVAIGSVAGFLPLPFQACYSASKAALASLIRATANEAKPYGIQCLIVQPGDTRTGFTAARVFSPLNTSLPDKDRFERSIERMARDEQQGMTAQKLAQLIVKRTARRRMPVQYTPGALYRLAWFLNRILPLKMIQWVMYRMYAS